MTVKEASTHFYNAFDVNCAEAVLHGANEALSLGLEDKDYKLLGAFGSGCGCGGICGAAAACVAVIGLKNIKTTAHSSDAQQKAAKLIREIRTRFGGENCSTLRKQFYTRETRCCVTVANIAGVLDDLKDELL